MSKQRNQPTIVPEQIHLLRVNIFKSIFDTSEAFLENPVPLVGFSTGIFQEQGHNLEEKKLRVRLSILLDGLDEANEEVGLKAEFGIDFHFKVDNMQAFFRTNAKRGVEQDIKLAATVLGIAVSTARGIILERTKGTSFNGVILPVIDVVKILEGNKN